MSYGSGNRNFSNYRGNRGRGSGQGEYNNNNNDHNYNNRIPQLNDEEKRLIYLDRKELFSKEYRFPLYTALQPEFEEQLIDQLFHTPRWKIEELMSLKSQINATRNKLNDKDIQVWHQLTRKTNMTGKIVFDLRQKFNVEMCTNAWIKIAEIYSHFPALLPPSLSVLPNQRQFKSIHLCEAPGAFICATNHYLRQRFPQQFPQWQWTGLSLNPYYEGNDSAAMIDDDRFIVETLDRWYFGVDNSGNILHQDNIRGLWEKYAQPQKVLLVTSDGSVDASGDPNEQESLVSELHYTEAVAAMGALHKNGSFVLKMFNLFECETICLIYLLSLHFNELNVYKPATSKAANAETYIVCISFRGISDRLLHALLTNVSSEFPKGRALLPLSMIPINFRQALLECAKKFTLYQINAIERNLGLEKVMNNNVSTALNQLLWDVKDEYVRKCGVRALNHGDRLVNHLKLDGSAPKRGNSGLQARGGVREREGGKLEDRMARKNERNEFVSGKRKTEDERSEDAPGAKKKLVEQEDSSKQITVVEKMMQRVGWKKGQGLGVAEQGRTVPIEVSLKDDRLGLGHRNRELSTLATTIHDEPLFEEFDKAPPRSIHPFEIGDDPRTMIISSHSKLQHVIASIYVGAKDLENLYRKREQQLDKNVITQRSREHFLSENYDLLNSAAFKFPQTGLQLASLDALLKVVSDSTATPLKFIVSDYGFAEYIFWQQSGCVQGYMIREKKIPDQVFELAGISTVSSFEFIPHKVNFISSDITGNSGNSRYLEYDSKLKLVTLCQRVFRFLERGGNFVCKLTDQFTRFTGGIIYLLYRIFKRVTIVKPFMLNPASSERFLVCQEFQGAEERFHKHLEYIAKQLSEFEDVLEVVPFKCLLEKTFQQYLADTAQRLLQREVQALTRLEGVTSDKRGISEEDIEEAKQLLFRTERRVVAAVPASSTVIEPDDGIHLPEGWSKEWSKREEKFYFYNRNTKESIWESDWKIK